MSDITPNFTKLLIEVYPHRTKNVKISGQNLIYVLQQSMALTAPILKKHLINDITLRSSKPNFTPFGTELWKVHAEIHLRP
jgi:hypothetical protein